METGAKRPVRMFKLFHARSLVACQRCCFVWVNVPVLFWMFY